MTTILRGEEPFCEDKEKRSDDSLNAFPCYDVSIREGATIDDAFFASLDLVEHRWKLARLLDLL